MLRPRAVVLLSPEPREVSEKVKLSKLRKKGGGTVTHKKNKRLMAVK